MEPDEALGIAAQIAIALAGFAVVVFRREAVRDGPICRTILLLPE